VGLDPPGPPGLIFGAPLRPALPTAAGPCRRTTALDLRRWRWWIGGLEADGLARAGMRSPFRIPRARSSSMSSAADQAREAWAALAGAAVRPIRVHIIFGRTFWQDPSIYTGVGLSIRGRGASQGVAHQHAHLACLFFERPGAGAGPLVFVAWWHGAVPSDLSVARRLAPCFGCARENNQHLCCQVVAADQVELIRSPLGAMSQGLRSFHLSTSGAPGSMCGGSVLPGCAGEPDFEHNRLRICGCGGFVGKGQRKQAGSGRLGRSGRSRAVISVRVAGVRDNESHVEACDRLHRSTRVSSVRAVYLQTSYYIMVIGNRKTSHLARRGVSANAVRGPAAAQPQCSCGWRVDLDPLGSTTPTANRLHTAAIGGYWPRYFHASPRDPTFRANLGRPVSRPPAWPRGVAAHDRACGEPIVEGMNRGLPCCSPSTSQYTAF